MKISSECVGIAGILVTDDNFNNKFLNNSESYSASTIWASP